MNANWRLQAMRRGQLRDCFTGVGVKRLSAVDAEPRSSNQHEIGTTKGMREQFLGEAQRRFRAVYVWLGRNQNNFAVESTATHYDARRNKPDRAPEWRLYYPSNPVTEAMREGDTLFLAGHRNGLLYFVVAPNGSTSERQLSWLFDLIPTGNTFVTRDYADNGPELGFAARFMLDEIGVEIEEPDAEHLDNIIAIYGTTFPRTSELSRLARQCLPDVRAEDDPDEALVEWLTLEEALFRRLERRVVAERLEQGFIDNHEIDVDSFIKYSLSVQNRRKARMGHALENHLEAVFTACDISCERGKITEQNHRPDFLFPSADAYHAAPATGAPSLAMLGAKSSCKERWRQVLTEAAKIPDKHLLTLEPRISEQQTDQMTASNLQLVVPQSIHETYTASQQAWLWNLSEFVREMLIRQNQ